MGADQKIYLVDFGAVQSQGNAQGVTFTIIGTSGYAPLEQFWGRAVPASDLYALGATLIHLLTGISPVDLPQKNYHIQFPENVNINPSLANWINKITEIDLEIRFKNAREALKCLNSKPKYKNLLNPQKRSLIFSIININKSPDIIEIYTHAPSLREIKKSGLFGAVFCIFFGLLLTNIVYGILFFIIFCAGVFILLGERNYIYFDHNYFRIERRLLDFVYGKYQGKTKDIVEVVSSKFESGYQVIVLSQNNKYQLDKAMNIQDSTSLVEQINEWLNQIN